MIAAAILLAQYVGTLDLLDTAKIGMRATQPPPQLAGPPREIILAMDLSTTPAARLRLAKRRWDWTLSYSPILTAPDAELGLRWPSGSSEINDAVVLHAGLVTFAWHDRLVRVTLSEAGSYGRLSSALLLQTPVAPGLTPMATLQSVPNPASLEFGSSNTDGNMAIRLERRITVSVSGGYTVGGGLTALAQSVLPEQYGPRAGVSFATTLSGSDTVATLANAQNVTTSGQCQPPTRPPTFCREITSVVQLQETFRHQVSTNAALSVGAGAALTDLVRRTNGQEILVLEPVGVVALSQRLSGKPARSLTLSAQLTPFVDILTGVPSERVQITAAVSGSILPSVLVTLTTGAMESAPLVTSDQNLLTVISGGIDARIRLNSQVDLGVGAQGFWQNQENFPAFASEIGYVSMTARAPTLHF